MDQQHSNSAYLRGRPRSISRSQGLVNTDSQSLLTKSPNEQDGTKPIGQDLSLGSGQLPAELKGPTVNLRSRLDFWSPIVLVTASIVILAVISFLTFLWFANAENGFWHIIVLRNWLTTAISASTFLIRTAVDFQSGVCAAMLAAIVLESTGVRLPDVATLSTMRSGSDTAGTVAIPIVREAGGGRSTARYRNAASTIALVFITSVLQLSSTILLSDLWFGPLPGMGYSTSISYDFSYDCFQKAPRPDEEAITYPDLDELEVKVYDGGKYCQEASYNDVRRVTAWVRNPTVYPVFGEYSQRAPSQDGIDDTGVLLRALLPFSSQQSRETVINYTGKAVVLDARVSCHPTHFESVEKLAEGIISVGNMTGTLSPPDPVPKSIVPTLVVPFQCELPNPDWTTICQLEGLKAFNQQWDSTDPLDPESPDSIVFPNIQISDDDFGPDFGTLFSYANSAGGLISEFWSPSVIHNRNENDVPEDEHYLEPNVTAVFPWGPAYLVIQLVDGDDRIPDKDYKNITGSGDKTIQNAASFTYAKPRNQWTDVIVPYSMDQYSPDGENTTYWLSFRPTNISITLCYAAWDTARLDVQPTRDKNRSEPVSSAGKASLSSKPAFSDVLLQLGQHPDKSSPSDRGILALEKKSSWLPSRDDARPMLLRPPLQADMGDYTNQIDCIQGNVSTMIGSSDDLTPTFISSWDITTRIADPSLAGLFLENLNATGSVAFALSSLITVMSSMMYYDQFPLYNHSGSVTQAYPTVVLLPAHHRGFVAVIALLVTHLCLVGVITAIFVRNTRLTLLGNAWSGIAQLLSPETTDILRKGTLMTDEEVIKDLRKEGMKNIRLRAAYVPHEQRVRVVRTGFKRGNQLE
jgi:hypothetical protein